MLGLYITFKRCLYQTGPKYLFLADMGLGSPIWPCQKGIVAKEVLLPRALLISMSSSLYCDLAAFMVVDKPLLEAVRSGVDVIYTSWARRLHVRTHVDGANCKVSSVKWRINQFNAQPRFPRHIPVFSGAEFGIFRSLFLRQGQTWL